MKKNKNKSNINQRNNYLILYLKRFHRITISILFPIVTRKRRSCKLNIDFNLQEETSTQPQSNRIGKSAYISFRTAFLNISKNCSFNRNRLSFSSLAIICLFIGIQFSSCKKLIDVDPPINEIVAEEIYNSNTTAASVLTGIYTDMSDYGIFTGPSSISVRAGLSADELITTTEPSNILTLIYENNLTNNGSQVGFWTSLYAYIFRVNSAIEGILSSNGITPNVKRQLIAEAKFLRAFMYFHLVNLYQNVPLLLTTDLKTNSSAARVDQSLVIDQIIKDLLEAESELSEDYLSADAVTKTSIRVRPCKSAATALLARVYLYTSKWNLAEEKSTELISNTTTYKLESLANTFLTDSKEAIWQLQPVGKIDQNTLDGLTFVLFPGNGNVAGPNGNQFSRPVFLSPEVLNSFEIDDKRKTNWIDSVIVSGVTYPFAYKYKAWEQNKPRTEYLMVLRLGEQYLIRAEARAQQGKITGINSAMEDLNTVRARAGLSSINIAGQPEILLAILQERKVELFTEWGHRWFDLIRTRKINDVMSNVAPTKGSTWSPYKALFPIPVEDIQRNPSLRGHQNLGYPEH